MKTLPTFSQIREVKRLLMIGMYDVSSIARMTRVTLRDVFRIEKSLIPPIVVAPDGTILDGNYQLITAR